nr:hypothetical protein [Nocardioides massiliensis]
MPTSPMAAPKALAAGLVSSMLAPPATTPRIARNSTTRITPVTRMPTTELRPISRALSTPVRPESSNRWAPA